MTRPLPTRPPRARTFAGVVIDELEKLSTWSVDWTSRSVIFRDEAVETVRRVARGWKRREAVHTEETIERRRQRRGRKK